MTDNRFPSPGTDARFPSPGTDVRFADAGVDARFLDGVDTRFEGPTYGGGAITATVDPTAYAYSDGDTVGDHPSFATLDNTGNYASSEGTIASVEWLVNGTDQASSFTLSAGESVVVRVTDSAANTREWAIDASVAAIAPAQFGTGDWSLANDGVNVTLTVSTLPDDGGSALTDLEYAVNGGSYTSLGAATTGDYTITASEGNTVTLRAVNVAGNGTASASKTVPAAPATGPTNTVAPVVSGTPTVGETLSTTNGTWSGVGTITYAYQWLDDGADISGATSSTYTLQAAEEGGLISCRVTATDDNGSTAATSNSLGPVAPIITATVAPAAEPLEDGDLLSSIANFATLDTTGNYASSAGTIASVEWLVNGTDQASSFTLSAGESVVVRVTDSAANTRDWTIDASVAAIAPAQFGTGDWSLANDGVNVTLTVSTLPDDGGSALTDLEYKVNSGSWTSLGAAATGDYTITASEADTVTLRAVNAVGNGTASASKTVPASGAALDLNFATGTYVDNASNTTLATIATFARSSSATYVDSSGVVQTASSGTIRDAHHEWNGSSWVRKGLLLETDAATNFLPYSEDFTEWFINDAIYSSGVLTAVTNNARIYEAVTFGAAGNHVFWIDLKAGTGTIACIRVINYDTNYTCYFDLSAGTVGTDAGSVGSIFEVGDGIYRCVVTFNSTDVNGTIFVNVCDADGSLNVTTGKTMNMYRAQAEDGDYPSSYILTSGATATRAGETLSVNAAGVPWSTTAMSMVWEGAASWVTGDGAYCLGHRVSGGHSIALYVGADDIVRAYNETSNVTEVSAGGSIAAGHKIPISIGMRVTATELQVVVAGTAGANETANNGIFDYGAANDPLFLGYALGGYSYNGTIQRLRMWDSDIGASELETETT